MRDEYIREAQNRLYERRRFLVTGAAALGAYHGLRGSRRAEAAIALANSNAVAAEVGSAGTTISVTFVNNITSGNLLVVAVGWVVTGAFTDDVTVADGGVNTYSYADAADLGGSSSHIGRRIAYVWNCAGGGTKPTVTASLWTDVGHGTPASRSFRWIAIHEFSGVQTSSDPLDQHGTATAVTETTGANGAVCPTSTVTPTTDGQLIFGMIFNGSGSGAITAGTGFTELVGPTGFPQETEYLIQSVAAPIQAKWTIAAADVTAKAMATFKAAPVVKLQLNPNNNLFSIPSGSGAVQVK